MTDQPGAPRAFLQDRFLVGCATLLLLAIIGAVVALQLLGEGDAARGYLGLMANGLVGLLVLVGVGGRQAETGRRLNGELDVRIRDAVHQALNERHNDAQGGA